LTSFRYFLPRRASRPYFRRDDILFWVVYSISYIRFHDVHNVIHTRSSSARNSYVALRNETCKLSVISRERYTTIACFFHERKLVIFSENRTVNSELWTERKHYTSVIQSLERLTVYMNYVYIFHYNIWIRIILKYFYI